MRRPAGVIVACIFLGFGTLTLLLASVGLLLLSTMMGHMPIPTAPGQPAPDPGVISGAMVAFGIVCLLPTAWAGTTLVGLARMKNWARYSIIIMGAGLVFFSLLGLLGTILSQTLMATTQQSTGQDPAMLRLGMMINGVTFFVMMGIGIWWIVYFALRSTRDAFTLATAPPAKAIPSYTPTPSPYAASTYEVASYIPAPEPNEPDPSAAPVPSPVMMLDQAVTAPTAPVGRPLAITIIAVLMLIGFVFSIPYAFLPFPAFLFGMEFTGWSGHLIMATFAVATGLGGIGLWRMKKAGLYIAYAMPGLGLLNCASFLLPSVRTHMLAYQQNLAQNMPIPAPQAAFQSQMMAAILLPMMIFSAALCLVIMVLLFMNRAAFDRATEARSGQDAAA